MIELVLSTLRVVKKLSTGRVGDGNNENNLAAKDWLMMVLEFQRWWSAQGNWGICTSRQLNTLFYDYSYGANRTFLFQYVDVE